MQRDLNLLKSVLSVPTKTYKEEKMINFLVEWLMENNLPYRVDSQGNIYVTKDDGTPKDKNFYYPCVVAHTDTVHEIDSINIKEEMLKNYQGEKKLSLKAYNDQGKPTGIGGDNKCGVFACLELLKELPNLKASFFVSEETGCHGSKNADEEFFKNVGYAIQFDAPENWMISENCSGEILFDRNSEFFKHCDVVLKESMNRDDMRYMVHPYTDVYALKSQFDFSCINFSIGYYDYHSDQEYVVIEDVENGIKMGRKMIEKLGYKLHYKKSDSTVKFGRYIM